MKPSFIRTTFFALSIGCMTGVSSIAAVRSGDRLQEISGSIFKEQSVESAPNAVPTAPPQNTTPASKEITPPPAIAPVAPPVSAPAAVPAPAQAPAPAPAPVPAAAPAPVKPQPAAPQKPVPAVKAPARPEVKKATSVKVDATVPAQQDTVISSVTFAAVISTDSLVGLVSSAPLVNAVETPAERARMDHPAHKGSRSLKESFSSLTLFQMVASVAAASGFLLLCGFVIKKFRDRRSGFIFKQPLVNVLGHSCLSPRKTLYIVEVMGKILVLGVTDENIQLLSEMDPAALENTLKEKKPPLSQTVKLRDGDLQKVLEQYK